MFGNEDGATILVGEDGDLVSANLPGKIDYFLLVHPDQGTENWPFSKHIGYGNAFQRLAGHLPKLSPVTSAPAPLRQPTSPPP